MTLAVAFLGGLVSCLSPCVLPVLPVFTAYVGGGAQGAFGSTTTPGRARAAGYLLGFAGVFRRSLGVARARRVRAVREGSACETSRGGGDRHAGLATALGWQPMLSLARLRSAGSFGVSLLLGAGVAIGWTPCIGPTLGAILTLAASSQSVWAGALLLVAYALGMSIPFLIVAFGLSRFRPLMTAVRRHHTAFQVASGGLIVIVGVLVATNAFARLAGLVPWVF
jgi:cytochrome c-type biogenesis protein